MGSKRFWSHGYWAKRIVASINIISFRRIIEYIAQVDYDSPRSLEIYAVEKQW
jgi:hypothetical protein